MMSFFEFLEPFRVFKGARFTHSGIEIFKGKYCIPENKYDIFWKLYHKHVFQLKKPCDLIEKHDAVCCLLYDLDFALPLGCTSRAYNEQMICLFIQCVTRVASRYIDEEYTTWDCLVLEKANATEKKGRLKDGIHIMFPYIITEPGLQQMIREDLLIELDDIDLFDKSKTNIQNSIQDIVDKAVIDKNGWMLLGSCKPDGLPYKLTSVYGYNSNDEVGNKFPNKRQNSRYLDDKNIIELLKLCSIRNHDVAPVIARLKDDMKDYVEQWIDDYNKENEKKIIPIRKNHHLDKGGNSPNLCIVRDLTSILNAERAGSYSTWIEVGWCLFNISPELLDCWVKFSKRAVEWEHVAETECEKEWAKMKKRGSDCKGLGTLYMWAKQDNPDAYKEIIQKDKDYLICQVVKNSSYEDGVKGKVRMRKVAASDMIFNIVVVLQACYGREFICTNYEKKTWFRFKVNRWHLCDGDVELKRIISTEMLQDFKKCSIKYRHLSEKLHPEHPNKKKYKSIADDLCHVQTKLKCGNFKKKIMDVACEQLWFEPKPKKFEDLLDTKNHLILLNNGVYDFEGVPDIEGKPKGRFRAARCDDYLSLSTNIDWKEFSWSDDVIKEVMNFIETIMQGEEERDYLLRCMASFLHGEVKGEILHFWTGKGSNGKSILGNLIKNTLGDYYDILDISCLTQKRAGSEKARPELAKLKGKRVVFCQEPSGKDQLNVGIVKELTGGDTISVRQLHKEHTQLTPQFKLILTCNDLPKVSSEDNGTWRRIKPLPFESEFVEDPDPNNKRQQKSDPDLKNKMIGWEQGFFWILTQYYPNFKEHGYKSPPKVLEKLQEYRHDSSHFAEFMKDYIMQGTKSDELLLDEIFPVFQCWFKQTIDDKVPNRKEFIKHVERQYGKLAQKHGKKIWIGYKQVENCRPSYMVENI